MAFRGGKVSCRQYVCWSYPQFFRIVCASWNVAAGVLVPGLSSGRANGWRALNFSEGFDGKEILVTRAVHAYARVPTSHLIWTLVWCLCVFKLMKFCASSVCRVEIVFYFIAWVVSASVPRKTHNKDGFWMPQDRLMPHQGWQPQ